MVSSLTYTGEGGGNSYNNNYGPCLIILRYQTVLFSFFIAALMTDFIYPFHERIIICRTYLYIYMFVGRPWYNTRVNDFLPWTFVTIVVVVVVANALLLHCTYNIISYYIVYLPLYNSDVAARSLFNLCTYVFFKRSPYSIIINIPN